jgi:hypothetical protein
MTKSRDGGTWKLIESLLIINLSGHKSKNLQSAFVKFSKLNKLLKPFTEKVKGDFNWILSKNKKILKTSQNNLQIMIDLILCWKNHRFYNIHTDCTQSCPFIIYSLFLKFNETNIVKVVYKPFGSCIAGDLILLSMYLYI